MPGRQLGGFLQTQGEVISCELLGKLIQKLLLNQKCMGYLVRAYYGISSTRYYKDESFWNADLKSKTTEDIISNRSFMEVLVLNHYVLVKNELAEYKESLENSSKEIAASNSNQEKEGPPQDSDIRQLIREECCVEVCEEQKQNMENTILELVEICRQKEFFCMHDNEVKNVIEQPTERRTSIVEPLQNFRVIHKSSTYLKNTSQISPVHAIAPILSTEEPEHSLSMRYEHLSTTPETESDEVIESSAKNLLPIPSECEVTLEDENNDDLTSSDDESPSEEDVPIEESKVHSNPLFDDDEINSNKLESHVESNFDALIDSVQKIDYLEEFSGELAHINPEIKEADFDFEKEICLIENLLYDNSSPQPLISVKLYIFKTLKYGLK
nr:hypothetical protein [Tanacetum cinerariifolium]